MPYKDKDKQKAYQQEWQKNNRKPRSLQGGVTTKKNLIIEAKNKPCELCGGSFHSSAMHFHHIDPAEKVASISELQRRGSVAQILQEMAKCVLVCANCHAEIHAGVREVPRAGIEPARPEADAF